MPELAVLHSGRAVALVGTDVVAKVTNNGSEALLLGVGNVTEDNFEHRLEPGRSTVLKGPLSGLATSPTPVTVEDDPDVLRAEAKRKAPEKTTASPKKTRKR